MDVTDGAMWAEVGRHLRAAEKAAQRATAILGNPKGHKPEELEDALNEAQDETYKARGAYQPAKVVD